MIENANMSQSTILLTGASGGLGSALYQVLKAKYSVIGLCFKHPHPQFQSIDLRDERATGEIVLSVLPDIIIHTVGLTDVDLCDRDFSLALATNVHTTLNIRKAAEAIGAKVVLISTSDVFDGEKGLYHEDEIPHPINMYAWTKYVAEQMLYRYPHSLILRLTTLSWFTSGKTALVQWIVDSLQNDREIALFTDQFNSPLYVGTVARIVEKIMHEAKGLYHLGSERKSRWEMGVALAEALNLKTHLVGKGSLQAAHLYAPRPKDVSLNCARLKQEWGLHFTLEEEIQKLVQDKPL